MGFLGNLTAGFGRAGKAIWHLPVDIHDGFQTFRQPFGMPDYGDTTSDYAREFYEYVEELRESNPALNQNEVIMLAAFRIAEEWDKECGFHSSSRSRKIALENCRRSNTGRIKPGEIRTEDDEDKPGRGKLIPVAAHS